MADQSVIPKRIAVSIHPDYKTDGNEVQPLKKILTDLGARELFIASIHDPGLKQAISEHKFNVVIALGGDGTMLRTARICSLSDTPILGINLGHFGFLMAIQRHEWDELLPRFMHGEYHLEERMMLEAIHLRKGEKLNNWHILNDVVVCRGQHVRPIEISAAVDTNEIARYLADGLITATPTGSTAYALAAGGPILPPTLRNFLIIPVAPHRSLERAIILPEESIVTITVRTTHDVVLSVDGQAPVNMNDNDQLIVQTSKQCVKFIQFHDPGTFYHRLLSSMGSNSFSVSET
jgi:NAD+ kinase